MSSVHMGRTNHDAQLRHLLRSGAQETFLHRTCLEAWSGWVHIEICWPPGNIGNAVEIADEAAAPAADAAVDIVAEAATVAAIGAAPEAAGFHAVGDAIVALGAAPIWTLS